MSDDLLYPSINPLVKGFQYFVTVDDILPGFIVVSLQHGSVSYRGSLLQEKNQFITYGIACNDADVRANTVDKKEEPPVCVSPRAPEDILETPKELDLNKLSSLYARSTYVKDDFIKQSIFWPAQRERAKLLQASPSKDKESSNVLCAKCRRTVGVTGLMRRSLIKPVSNKRKKAATGKNASRVPAKRAKLNAEHSKKGSSRFGSGDSACTLNEQAEDGTSPYSFTSSELTDHSCVRVGDVNGDVRSYRGRRNSTVSRASAVTNTEDADPRAAGASRRKPRYKKPKREKKKVGRGQWSPASYSSGKSGKVTPRPPNCTASRPDSSMRKNYAEESDESGDLVIDLGPDEPARAKHGGDSHDEIKGKTVDTKSSEQLPRQPLMLKFTTRKTEYIILHDGRELHIEDVVWAKVTGYPWWPSRIVTLYQMVKDDKVVEQTADIIWYGSTSWSPCECDDLFPFVEYFKDKFSKKRKGSYWKAVKAAAAEVKTKLSMEEGGEMSHSSESVNLAEILALTKSGSEHANRTPRPGRPPRRKVKAVPTEPARKLRTTRSSAVNGLETANCSETEPEPLPPNT